MKNPTADHSGKLAVSAEVGACNGIESCDAENENNEDPLHVQHSIFGRSLDVIDDEDIDKLLPGLQLEAELLL